MDRFADWAAARSGRDFRSYQELWQWSVDDLTAFWAALWDYYGVRSATAFDAVLDGKPMPDARWFAGATLNYAEHLLGGDAAPDALAVVSRSQTVPPAEMTWRELREAVARARAGLAALGVRPGDTVAAYLPNIPETVVAFLAVASLGAVWSSCAPEFGTRSVLDRFSQIEPVVLLAVPGYTYRDKHVDRRDAVAAVSAGLPTLTHVVEIPYGPGRLDRHGTGTAELLTWERLLDEPAEPQFAAVSFDHPLWVLFSSGTTGLPKAIVHGHGGVLLEHLKVHDLHFDTQPGDRFLWFTTTSWMMWNIVVSALLRGACIVVSDGDPTWPSLAAQWALAAETRATSMGTSPAYLMSCRKEGVRPAQEHDLTALRQLGVTGSPLPVEGFEWFSEQFAGSVYLHPSSGGTDVCSGFVGGAPWLPITPGAMAGRYLGVDALALDSNGREVVDELGEFVVRSPMPSMPVSFWNDPGKARYRASYFETFPGLWRHGDWAVFRTDGSCTISGRSDATLNRAGVRLGTSEFYRVVEEFPEVLDSLVVHLEDDAGGPGRLLLFVSLASGEPAPDGLDDRLRAALRSELSPRYIPDEIIRVPEVPRTLTGKKIEAPVKQVLRGRRPEDVVNLGALVSATSLDAFVALALPPGRPER